MTKKAMMTLLFLFGMQTTLLMKAQGAVVDSPTNATQIKTDATTTKQEEEVVIVGYGTQKKSNVTSAVASVKAAEIQDQPVSNLASSLQGKMTGINVSTPSGTPGSGLLVAVRGANNPLYVVDGVPMLSESNSQISTSFDANGNSVGSGQNISSIADINPNDIESIEVLKDASAASIYGARSANGVVLVTTKKGKAGKTTYNVNYYSGVQSLRKKLPLMNSSQLYTYLKEAYSNDKAAWAKLSDAGKKTWVDNSLLAGTDLSQVEALLGSGGKLNFTANVVDEKDIYKSTTWDEATKKSYDWQDAVFRDALIQNIEVTARGGNEKNKFYVSGAYFDQNGIIIENNFKRYSFKLNTEFALNNALKLGSNLLLSNTQNRRTFNDNTYSGVLTNAIPASPLDPFYNSYDKANGGYFAYQKGTGYFLTDNPVKTASEIYGFTNGYRAFGNSFLEWKIIDGLKFKINGSMDYSSTEDILNLSSITTDASAVGGKTIEGNMRSLVLLNENTLNFSKQIEDHNIDILLGESVQKSSNNLFSLSSIGYLRGTNNFSTSNGSITTSGLGTGNVGWFVASFFGRINYDFQGKYLFSASLRADGSSRFSADKRWGVFPAMSVGWNMRRENFLKDNEILTGLKLRASVGTAGDQDISLYRYANFYTPSGYNNSVSYAPGLLADPSITWQKNTMYNLGLDYDLLHGKLSGSVELFLANRTDVLIPVPTSGVTGSSSIIKNGGTIQDRGIEFSVNYLAFQSKDWKFNLSANINFLKNEVVDLPIDKQLQSTYSDIRPSHIIQKGFSLGSFWGIQAAGYDADGNALFYNQAGNKVYYNNINYDNDAKVIGKARPDFYGGMGLDVSWKNLDLSVDFTYSYGNQVYNLIRAVYDNGGYQKLSTPTYNADKNEWTQTATTSNYFVQGTTIGPKPSLIKRNYIENSSTYVEDASFLRCKNINLGYTIKFERIKSIQSIRIYGQAQNLFVLTKYLGYDPEVSANGGANPYTAGVDYATYPQPRTFTLGFNITFQ